MQYLVRLVAAHVPVAPTVPPVSRAVVEGPPGGAVGAGGGGGGLGAGRVQVAAPVGGVPGVEGAGGLAVAQLSTECSAQLIFTKT